MAIQKLFVLASAALALTLLPTAPSLASPQSARLQPLPATGPDLLAQGQPPLTETMVVAMAEALGKLSGSPFTWTETDRLRQRAIAQWKRGVAYQDSIRQAHERLTKELVKVSAFPMSAQPAAWDERVRILRDDVQASPESFLTDALRRATSVASEPLVFGTPVLTKSAGQAYFEMRDYFQDLATGDVTQPGPTETLRGGVELGKVFPTLPDATRVKVAKSDRVWAVARSVIDPMKPEQRAELGRKISEVMKRPGAVDSNGTLTPDGVWAALDAGGLTAPAKPTYWSVSYSR